jgi:hypothetical protein
MMSGGSPEQVSFEVSVVVNLTSMQRDTRLVLYLIILYDNEDKCLTCVWGCT